MFVHCIEVIPISESPFREIPLYIYSLMNDNMNLHYGVDI